uniref:Uncharacterized protein n=1 Tax=Meloidogyne enterolobii TaxID=390850 RepID=A0A6V7UKI8_MELEN|nr:unnamed protein product [Meloidogyne enterolobii]
MTQCYLCRQTEIKHDHFCQHYRDPNSQNCDQCNKKCLLYEDANKIDQQIIIEIREKGETSVRFTTPTSPNRKSNIASNTSSAATTNSTSSNTDVIFIKILEGIIIGGLKIF